MTAIFHCRLYNMFHGSENSDLKPAKSEYAFVGSLGGLYRMLLGCWRRETCAPRLREKWCVSNPTCGQCSITAFLAQDVFGGEVYGVPNGDGSYHCFNVVGDAVFDLTSEQFDHPLEYTQNFPQSRDAHFAKAEKKSRYEMLKNALLQMRHDAVAAAPRLTTLCYIEKGGCWLVLHRTKKEHDENGDKWIGVGGKFEDGESPEECALREVKEETGLAMTEYRFRGIVTFVSDEWGTEYMHLFTCTAFEGELTDCDEGELVWLPKAELLSKKMWAGDRIFLKALDERDDFFSLKLCYRGEELVEAKFGK